MLAILRFLVPALIAVACGGLAIQAQASFLPREKPEIIYKSDLANSIELKNLKLGLEAAEAKDWGAVRVYESNATDHSVKDILLWRLLTQAKEDDLHFSELERGARRLENWPNFARIISHAEARIATSGLSPAAQISFLTKHGPNTGDGKLALAKAYLATGETSKAQAVISEAWQNSPLTKDAEADILINFPGLFSASDHASRVNMLLWRGQRSAASRLLSKLEPDQRKLAQARIKLQASAKGVDAAINAVSPDLQNDPGLLLDRAKWRRKKRMYDGAIDLFVLIDGADVVENARTRLWRERRRLIARMMKDGRYEDVYKVSASHGLTRGADFAENEFRAGWLALRKLSKPDQALTHFQTLSTGVGAPISVARAEFWTGEAYRALGNRISANKAYEKAARYDFTFYGQMAKNRLGPSSIYLPRINLDDVKQRSFNARPMVRAIRLLSDIGERSLLLSMHFALDDTLISAEDYLAHAKLSESQLLPRAVIRSGKTALGKGVIVPDAAYPTIELPVPALTSGAEQAFILALIRQESEFNPSAYSRAHAQGLMQMLASTARLQARKEGMSFDSRKLRDDPDYNMTLGSAHLGDLVERFGGSYIMAAAAYNAGPHRVDQWIEQFGDPRMDHIDPIDWIEQIPFSETRNYVQRLMENLQVYRARLAGGYASITLEQDLIRGR